MHTFQIYKHLIDADLESVEALFLLWDEIIIKYFSRNAESL